VHTHVNPDPVPVKANQSPAPAGTPSARATHAIPSDRKAERQARARVVQERAKLIGPLEKRVADLEALIVSLERERDMAFAALADASTKGDAATIAKLSKKSGEVGPRIEWAYGELEKATKELDDAVAKFDGA